MKKLILSLLLAAMCSGAAQASDTLTVRIKGMRCEECAHKVKTALRKIDGVGGIQFNLERRTATIAYDPAKTCTDTINARLAATGRYKASAYSPTDVIRRGYGQRIDDMHCKKCSDRIMERLGKMEGIDSLAPHLDKHYMFIRYDANRTCKADIRALLNKIGYTPVNYYTSDKIAWAYYNIPAEQATQETLDGILALDGVEDVNANAKRKSLAVTYFKEEVSAEKLLEEIQKMGINAVVPKPHVCDEEKK
jgi:copper ion binding protein